MHKQHLVNADAQETDSQAGLRWVTAAKNDDSCFAWRGFHSFIIHGSDVSYNVQDQPRVLEGVEV